jgi:hypothetical protein
MSAVFLVGRNVFLDPLSKLGNLEGYVNWLIEIPPAWNHQ